MKTLFTIFVALFLSTALEDRLEMPYFGVGATVQDLNDETFLVKTEGRKWGEGFVYTYPSPFSKEQVNAQITLQGKGKVIFKISETNSRGQFLKEAILLIELTEEWTTYELPLVLNSASSQIDLSILTKNKAETKFFFKGLKINEMNNNNLTLINVIEVRLYFS